MASGIGSRISGTPSGLSASSSQFLGGSSTVFSSLTTPGQQSLPDKLHEFFDFLYNPLTGKCMGRTFRDWAFLVLWYLSLYVAMATIIVGMGAICYVIINWNHPKYQGPDSLLHGGPGFGMRPQASVYSTLIRFMKGDSTTYTHYVDDIEAFLRYYENRAQEGENFIDCNDIRGRRTRNLDKVCRWQLEWMGPDCVKQVNYGFDDGQPCILLKLNKIYGWQPEEFTNETVPDEIREHWDQWHVTITCDGETAFDRENMGPLTYYPALGFPYKYFPFLNQQGYRSPIFFVRFERCASAVLIMVTCKAWAKNIVHDQMAMIGQIHFELLVD